MAKLVVASAQQQMRLFDSPDGYRKELTRFLNMAHAKGAELLVFPAVLAGVMAASHKVEGFRMNLLKQADDRQRGRSSVSPVRVACGRQHGLVTGRQLSQRFRRSFAS